MNYLTVLGLATGLLGTPALAAESPTTLDLATAKVIDLSYSYDETTVYWPTSPSTFELKQLAHGVTAGGFFYTANAFCTPEHGGTHLDAPIHFADQRHTVDQVPLRQLIAPAVVIDVSKKASKDPDYTLSASDVTRWEETHGRIEPGTIVMLRTGWGARWPDRKRYLGDDTAGDASNLHFPSYGESAARVLIEERKVGVLGVDTASIDNGPSRDFIVHQIAAGANVPGLENVANLEQLPPRGAWALALPMKIAGGSGGPVRIVGLLP